MASTLTFIGVFVKARYNRVRHISIDIEETSCFRTDDDDNWLAVTEITASRIEHITRDLFVESR
jgi:hypothetical protein